MPDLRDFFGEQCMSIDVNSMKPLDNLCHPVSVIRDAEALAADAFGCAAAFFMVGGTTSSVQAMILSCCGEGDKIIMPRNVHRSAVGALILSGAVPVYVDPGLDERLGIPLGMSLESVKAAIAAHPDAKAVFINNPTYYGVCTDAAGIIDVAHKNGILVLADEAHGTHFYFHDELPPGAMQLGADMAAVSIHKNGRFADAKRYAADGRYAALPGATYASSLISRKRRARRICCWHRWISPAGRWL